MVVSGILWLLNEEAIPYAHKYTHTHTLISYNLIQNYINEFIHCFEIIPDYKSDNKFHKMKSSFSNFLVILWNFLNARSIVELDNLLYSVVLICLILFCYVTNPLVCLFVFIFTTLPGAVITHLYFSGRLRNSKITQEPITQFYYQNSSKELENEIEDADSVTEADQIFDSKLDQTLSNFSKILVNNFITEWYTLLADNNELPNKSLSHIQLVLTNLCERAHSLPLPQLSTHLLLHGLTPFFSSLERVLQDTGSSRVTTESLLSLLQQARTVHNFESCEYAHPALRNEVATHMYAEHIFDLLLQASDLSSNLKDSFLFRSVLRDVISTSFILKLFDIISKPHFLYQCLTFVFSLQLPTESNSAKLPTQLSHNIIGKESVDDVITDTESMPSLRARNLKGLGKKSKSYDIPDRTSRCLVKKHSQTTLDTTAPGTRAIFAGARRGVGRDVPLSANPNSISIFDHELVHESLSSSYYVYSIWVPKVITSRFNQSDACIVKHRFREFEHLYRSLQNSCRELMRGISFPSKLSQIRIGTVSNQFIMRRRMLLERFLKSVCVRDLVLQTPEVQIFLGISTRRKQDITKANRSSKAINASDFGVSQNVEDVVLKLRVFVTKQLLSSPDTTDSLPLLPCNSTESLLPSHTPFEGIDDIIRIKHQIDTSNDLSFAHTVMSVLNGEAIDCSQRRDGLMREFPFTSSLYLFGATALRNKQLWINTETFLILLLEILGEYSTRTLEEKMEELNTNSRMCVYFEMLERKFFPDGRLHLVNSNTNSPEELSQAKNAACTAIFKFIPDLIKSIVGSDELRRVITYCLDCLSNPAMNRHLLLRLLDIFLLYLVPELSQDEFQQSLGVQNSNPQSKQI